METINNYTLVCADDWEGLYINGKLITEGHSVTLAEFIQAIGIKLEVKWANEKWLENRGNLTQRLQDIKFEDGN